MTTSLSPIPELRRWHDDGWRLPDWLWDQMEPLLPPRPEHPLGCHRPRVPDRSAMDAIFFVLRTGCQWNALRETGICSSSSAHHRFQEWVEAGVFEAFWREGLLAYDAVKGIDWTWLSLDGAMVKAPLGGGKNRPQPDRRKRGVKRSVLTDGRGTPIGVAIAGAMPAVAAAAGRGSAIRAAQARDSADAAATTFRDARTITQPPSQCRNRYGAAPRRAAIN